MNNEPLVGGGKLVRLNKGLGVESVPGAKRGLIVRSAVSYAYGEKRRAGRYQLTQRVVKGTDLWHVKRLTPAELPHHNDAQGWDDLRTREGCPSY